MIEEHPWLIWLIAGIAFAPVPLAVRGRRSARHRIVIALATSVGGLAAGAFLLRAAGLDGFGRMHYAFAASITAIPAVVAWGMLGPGARALGPMLRVGLSAMLLVPATVGLYAMTVEPRRLVLEEASVDVEGENSLRVGVLADIQATRVGSHERRAARLAMDQRPDLIVIPGDLLHVSDAGFQNARAGLVELLASLEAPLGVYVTLGDVDDPARIVSVCEEAGVRLLVNDCESVEYEGRTIAIAGLSCDWTEPESAAAVNSLVEADAQVRLLISHRPDGYALAESRGGVDLVISGHTHGGQVVLPFYGPPMTLSRVPRVVARGGLHRLGDQLVYVSRGIGVERGQAPPIRFNCAPEVSLITFQ